MKESKRDKKSKREKQDFYDKKLTTMELKVADGIKDTYEQALKGEFDDNLNEINEEKKKSGSPSPSKRLRSPMKCDCIKERNKIKSPKRNKMVDNFSAAVDVEPFTSGQIQMIESIMDRKMSVSIGGDHTLLLNTLSQSNSRDGMIKPIPT